MMLAPAWLADNTQDALMALMIGDAWRPTAGAAWMDADICDYIDLGTGPHGRVPHPGRRNRLNAARRGPPVTRKACTNAAVHQKISGRHGRGRRCRAESCSGGVRKASE